MFLIRNRATATAILAFTAALWVTSALASAQTQAPLPTAPGDNGSPLGPYLFTFILAGGGLIVAIAVKLCDRGVRSDEVRWKADGSRVVLGMRVI